MCWWKRFPYFWLAQGDHREPRLSAHHLRSLGRKTTSGWIGFGDCWKKMDFWLKKIWLQWAFPCELHFVAFSAFLLVGEYLFPKRNHNILGWSVGWVKHDVFFLKRNYPDIGLSSIYIYIHIHSEFAKFSKMLDTEWIELVSIPKPKKMQTKINTF